MMGMPGSKPSREAKRPGEVDAPTSKSTGIFVERQYNNSVGFNHGTISNYFIIKSDHENQTVDLAEALSSRLSRQGISDSTENELQTAQALFKSKHWIEAKVIFDKVLRDPNSALPTSERNRVRYNLAHAHFALAEFSDAAHHLQKLATILDNRNEGYEPAIADHRFWLGRCFYHLENYGQASEHFRTFLRTSEKRPVGEAGATKATDGRLWLGLTLDRLGEYESATEQLQTAFEIQNELAPDDLATLACRHHLANFLYKRKEYSEALQHFDGLFHAEQRLNGPEKTQSVMSRCMMAFCLAKLRRYEEAQPHLERVSDSMKLQTHTSSDQLRDRGLVHYWLGRITVDQMAKHNNSHFLPKAAGHLQIARQDISTAMAIDKTNDWLVEDMEDCKYYQARLMISRGDFADAEYTFRQLIKDDSVPSDAAGERQVGSRFGLAHVLYKQRRFEECRSILEEVVCPETPIEHCRHTGMDLAACLALLGETYLELRNPEKARDCFQHVVDVEPQFPSIAYAAAQNALATSMFDMGDFVGACKYSEAAYITKKTHFPPDQDISRGLLSWALCETSRFEEAEQYLHITFTTFPETGRRTPRSDLIQGNSRYYMGRILSHRQDWQGAVKQYKEALPLLGALDRIGMKRSQFHQCQYYMAISLFHTGEQTTQAAQMLERLLRDDLKTESDAIKTARLVSIPYWLGRVFLFQNKLKEAERWLWQCLDSLKAETALPAHPDISTGKVRYHYAHCLFLLDARGVENRVTDSVEAVRQTLNSDPKLGPTYDERLYHDCRLLLGRALHLKGEFDEACDYLRSSLAFLEDKHGCEDERTSYPSTILADCLCELGLTSEAHALVTQAANQHDTKRFGDAVIIKAIGRYWLGRRAYQAYQAGSGRGKAAEEYFTEALSLLAAWRGNPVRWNRIRLDSRHFLARIKLRRGQRDEAASMFQDLARKARESNEPNHAVDNEYYLGFTLSQQGKHSEALPVFQKILDANHPGRVVENVQSWCQFQLGDCLYNMEEFMAAKERFDLAAESPDTELRRKPRFRVGQSVYRVGRHEEAKEIFQSIVDIPDESTPQFLDDVRCWLGKALSKLEKLEVPLNTSEDSIDATCNE